VRPPGIGSTSGLQTQVSVLAAQTRPAHGRIDNTLGGPLAVEPSDGIVGIANLGSGAYRESRTQVWLTAAANVSGAGDVTSDEYRITVSSGDDLTVNSGGHG